MDQPKQPSILESMTNARDYWYGRSIALEHELETLKKPHAEPYKEGYMLLLADHTSLQARITELEAQLAQTPAIPPDVRETIRGLLESGIVGTKSTIRTRDYHGLRAFATTEEEWLSRYEAALSWLDAA